MFRAAGSVFAPGMLKVFVLSVLVSVGVLFGFMTGLSFFFYQLSLHASEMYAWALPWLGSIAAGIVAWMMFPAIMPVIVSFFDMRITRLIEQHDYATAQPANEAPFWGEFWHDVRFALKAVALNILVLPLYLVPGLNLILFYLLNGYLLGREYFVMAARRHMPVYEAEALRRAHGREVMAAGIVLTLLATVPLLNLLAPFWGVAVMVHLYHIIAKTPGAKLLPPA